MRDDPYHHGGGQGIVIMRSGLEFGFGWFRSKRGTRVA